MKEIINKQKKYISEEKELGKMRIKVNQGVEVGCVVNGTLWFVVPGYNWLCKMSVDNRFGEYVCDIPYAKVGSYDYKVIAGSENTLILTPMFANYILSYNIRHNSFEVLYTLEKESANKCMVKYRLPLFYQNKIYVLPQSGSAILEIEKENWTIRCCSKWMECLPSNYGVDENIWFGQGAISGDCIFIPCCHTNALVEISLKSKESRLHFLGKENSRFSQVICDGLFCWLLDYANLTIIKWNEKMGVVKELYLPLDGGEKIIDTDKFAAQDSLGLKAGSHLVLAPRWLNSFISINLKNDLIQYIATRPYEAGFISCSDEIEEGHIYFFSHKSDHLADYNIMDNSICMQKFHIEKVVDMNDNPLREPLYSLENYLEAIKKAVNAQ